MKKTLMMCAVFALSAAGAQAAQHDQNETGMMPQGDARMEGMMGQGGMDHPMMLTMMMAMMDTNGDNALSLEEVQAVHERMFGMADADGDGQLSQDEIQGFMMGGGMMGRSSQ